MISGGMKPGSGAGTSAAVPSILRCGAQLQHPGCCPFLLQPAAHCKPQGSPRSLTLLLGDCLLLSTSALALSIPSFWLWPLYRRSVEILSFFRILLGVGKLSRRRQRHLGVSSLSSSDAAIAGSQRHVEPKAQLVLEAVQTH